MLETTKNILATLFLLLIFIPVSFAQEPTPSPQNNPNRNLTERDFKSKIFEVKYRDAGRLAGVLQGLGSRAASVSANSEFKTITVRDYPENLVIMEEALKRLDTPVAPRPNIELHMHVLIASNTSGNKSDSTAQVPAELKDVLTQLRETLNYRNYELATSVVQRLTTEMSRGVEGRGTLEISREDLNAPNIQMPYEYNINFVSLMQNATGGPTVQINEFRFGAVTDKDHAGVQTALNLRDGEKVVVGTATIRNRALIVVLSARLIN
ncbi:MAG: hypothetical protein DMF74_09495 [Acidobacteria bacterium]|nr:MAG: hypothetical protein DMF74_09495 [Acidobacteriota bacterium]